MFVIYITTPPEFSTARRRKKWYRQPVNNISARLFAIDESGTTSHSARHPRPPPLALHFSPRTIKMYKRAIHKGRAPITRYFSGLCTAWACSAAIYGKKRSSLCLCEIVWPYFMHHRRRRRAHQHALLLYRRSEKKKVCGYIVRAEREKKMKMKIAHACGAIFCAPTIYSTGG
jgi:hypothetical protein